MSDFYSMNKKDYMDDTNPYPGYTLSGLYRGRVEDDMDPMHLGRVRVRIPNIHGVPSDENNPQVKGDYVDTKALPWCTVCQLGAGFQQGSFITPEVGTIVMVGFEAGGRDNPVVLGGIYSSTSDEPKVMGRYDAVDESKVVTPDDDKYVPNIGNSVDSFIKSGGQYTTTAGEREVPHEARMSPKNKVIYKSPKGAVIVITESDNKEEILIRDRGGQCIRMNSPIDEDSNKWNGLRSMRDGHPTPEDPSRLWEVSDYSHSISLSNAYDRGISLVTEVNGRTTIVLDADLIVSSSELRVWKSDADNDDGSDS